MKGHDTVSEIYSEYPFGCLYFVRKVRPVSKERSRAFCTNKTCPFHEKM